MGTKLKELGSKAVAFGKKAAPWLIGALAGGAAVVAVNKLSKGCSDDDEYDEYEEDYEDDDEEESSEE